MHQQIHTSKDRSRLERWNTPTIRMVTIYGLIGAFIVILALIKFSPLPCAHTESVAVFTKAASAPVAPPLDTHSNLLQVACGDMQTQGGEVTIGASRVTAWHVMDHCETPPRAHYPQSDLAVLELGDPGLCRNAILGEAVHFVGYPDLIRRDEERWAFNTAPEFDSGFIIRQGVTITWMNDGAPFPQRGVSIATATQVRPGYSGGPVLSQADGRVVGMVQAAGMVGEQLQVSFMPVEDICRRLNELIAAEQAHD